MGALDGRWAGVARMKEPARLVERLRAAGCVFAEDEAAMLVAEAGNPHELEAMVQRRIAGEPLEYVLGWAEFAGLHIAVTPGVFVPRPRSEFLVAEAAAMLRPGARVLDLCCGSGAIGAALLAALPGLELVAADLDPDAVASARRNLPAGTAVFQGDLYDAVPAEYRGRFDLIVANAPYVPTAEIPLLPAEARSHEAPTALDGGADGLELHRRIAAEARAWLAPHAPLLIETSERQAPVAARIFARNGLTPKVRRSDDLDATVVVGVPKEPSIG
jgi:release factor glutamine methyltransferase